MVVYLPWITFFIGILVGWLLTWLMMTGNKRDLQARVAQLENELHNRDADLVACENQSLEKAAEFKEQIKSLKTDLKTCRAELKTVTAELEARNKDFEASAGELEILKLELAELQAAAAAAALDSGRSMAVDVGFEVPEIDDFTKITGIGPALAARLSNAGIYRYADLAHADHQELPDALGIRPWQKVEPEVWVAEAAVLAEKPTQVSVGDDLTLLEGVGPTYATRLRASGITTFEQLAGSNEETLAMIIAAPAWRRPNFADWIAQARLAAAGDDEGFKALQEELFARQDENLVLIAGIGTQSQEVLHKGGIHTYAALAAADPADLSALFAAEEARSGDFEAWIAEAKLRAAGKRVQHQRKRAPELEVLEVRSCPQDLELIYGVGTVYEQRLYEVGIGSFWEVGMLPEAELEEILDAKAFQDVDLAAIKVDALRLAEETGSMGHVWDGSEPDNFEPLEGIGPVLERRLYAAGICTFEALAKQTKEYLAEVCHAPAFQKVDYGRWIEQAKERLS
ncbi:MAG: helix-hairpin-helix domain-containing protein [Candidatus Promineifilaceae bacterium]|jgi:predicted flap endonuclease-1-like 5' DNA nuclease